MRIVRRAVEILRTEGLRSLLWRALAITVYRRLILVGRRLDAGPPLPAATVPVEGDFLTGETAGDYTTLRPDTPAAEVERRLRTGQRCLLVRRDGTPVSALWLATGRAEMPYVDLVLDLPDGVTYVHDVYTAPAARGLGISASTRTYYEHILREEGCHTLLGTAMPGNVAGLRLVEGAGYSPVGAIGCVRLGPFRVPVGRPPPGYASAAHRARA